MKAIKRTCSIIIALAIAAVCGLSAMAADTTDTGTGTVTGNIAVNGSITPLTISVTHPLSVDYAINPNSGTTVPLPRRTSVSKITPRFPST